MNLGHQKQNNKYGGGSVDVKKKRRAWNVVI